MSTFIAHENDGKRHTQKGQSPCSGNVCYSWCAPDPKALQNRLAVLSPYFVLIVLCSHCSSGFPYLCVKDAEIRKARRTMRTKHAVVSSSLKFVCILYRLSGMGFFFSAREIRVLPFRGKANYDGIALFILINS